MPDTGVNSIKPYKTIYKHSYCFQTLKDIAFLLSYTCKSFIEFTPGPRECKNITTICATEAIEICIYVP